MTSTAGLRWRVDGAGRDLVLVHGWALALDYWDTVVPLLTQRFRVLRFDRRGFGGSGGAPSLDADCADLLHLMGQVGMERAAVLGMSQGARVAVDVALAEPRRIRALILDGPPLLGSVDSAATSPEQEVPLQQLLSLWRKDGDAALQDAVKALPLMNLVSPTPAAGAALERCVAAYRGADLAQAQNPSRVQPVESLRCPVLIINGKRDSAQRLQAGMRLAQQIAGCHRSAIPGVGHLTALDAPARYAELLGEFLSAGT